MEREPTPKFDDERFSRLEQMVGANALAQLRRSFVTVVGLGAVGSYAVEALARSGVGRLRLVDFDVVHRTNINRQLYALESTVGEPKCEVARRRVLDIARDCRVECLNTFVHRETLDRVLDDRPDLVIDAIDSVNPKTELLATVRQREIPLVASMGAALRTDPTKLRVGPLAATENCPLAAMMRKRLRNRGVPLDIPCVYSIESIGTLRRTAIGNLEDVDEQPHPRGRQRASLGSLPTLTGIFGLTVANTAIQMLLSDTEVWPGKIANCPV